MTKTIHEKRAELLRKRGLRAEVENGRVSVGTVYINNDSVLFDGRLEVPASALGHILESIDEFPAEPETLTPQWLVEVTTACAGWEVSSSEDEETLMCYAGAGLALMCKPDRTFRVRAVRRCGAAEFTPAFMAASEAVRALVAKGWRASV